MRSTYFNSRRSKCYEKMYHKHEVNIIKRYFRLHYNKVPMVRLSHPIASDQSIITDRERVRGFEVCLLHLFSFPNRLLVANKMRKLMSLILNI